MTVGSTPRIVGRYAIFGEIASGGMATVHFGRLLGPVGFARTVAIKCLHAHFAKDPEFVAMFLDEARLAARVRHPNVVATLDVVALDGELFLVMEYIQGEALSQLWRVARERSERIPPKVAVAIVVSVLQGLHAAHEATSELGAPLGIAHRDVSPQNVLVGADGVARVLDFGIAKATGRIQITREGRIKGKTGYMSLEQLSGGVVDRRTDIYSASVVLWEALTGMRLFDADNQLAAADKIRGAVIRPPGELLPDLRVFDSVVMRGLARDPAERFASAREMALTLERCAGIATASEVGEWVEVTAGRELRRRAHAIAQIESASSDPSDVRRLQTDPPPALTPLPMLDDGAPVDSDGAAVTQSVPMLGDRTDADHDAPTHARAPVPAQVTMVHRARPSRQRAVLATVLAAVACAVVVTSFVVTRITSVPQVVTQPAAASVPDTVIGTPPNPTASSTVTTRVPEVAGRPNPVDSPGSSPPSPPVARPPVWRSRVDCQPPYSVDAQGIRHIKRQCL